MKTKILDEYTILEGLCMTQYLFVLLSLLFYPLCADNVSLTIPKGVMVSCGLSGAFVAKFSLFAALLLLWTIVIGKVLQKITRCPVIAGQIIGGILLGPSCIDIAGYKLFAEPFTMIDNATGLLYRLASSDLFIFFILLMSAAFTVSYLMWIAGHETDIRDIIKVGVTAVTAGILGALLPIASMYIIAELFFAKSFSLSQSIGMGLIFSATSVSIPVAMLFAQGKMHLQSSKATLGAAIIDDIFAVILLSIFFISLQSGSLGAIKGYVSPMHNASIGEAVVYMILSFMVIFFVGYYIIPAAVRRLHASGSSHIIASVANGGMLLYFAFAEIVGGLAGVTGAYFAGLFHRMGDDRHQAERVISPFVNAVLLPLFLGSIGLQIDISLLTYNEWIMVLVLLIGAIISKMVACYIATELSNISKRRKTHQWSLLETYLFGSSMVARGEVGLVISTILRSSQVITAEQYVVAVVVIVLTTIVAPLMLNIGFAYLDSHPSIEQDADYELHVGHFQTIGTEQFFNSIIQMLESIGTYKTTITFSDGRKIAHIECQKVKIIMGPEEGIICKGNKHNIMEMLRLVKKNIGDDLAQIQ